MTFQEVAARVFSFYGDADYESALAVARDARNSFPDEDNTLGQARSTSRSSSMGQ